jgi:membrane-associated protease RseP (regulator of RpoE activity)
MEVLSDVLLNGLVVVRQGAPAVGEISRAKEARTMGRRGNVALTLNYVEAVTGEHILVGGNRAEKGNGKAAKLTAEIAVTTAVTGGLVGALWLFEKGHDSAIPPGTAFSVHTVGDTTLDLSLLVHGGQYKENVSPVATQNLTALLPRPMPSGETAFPNLGIVARTKLDLGAEVVSVRKDSPAEKAGLQVGHIISSVDGSPIKCVRDLTDTLANKGPGTAVRVSWLFRSNLGWMPTPDTSLLLTGASGTKP